MVEFEQNQDEVYGGQYDSQQAPAMEKSYDESNEIKCNNNMIVLWTQSDLPKSDENSLENLLSKVDCDSSLPKHVCKSDNTLEIGQSHHQVELSNEKYLNNASQITYDHNNNGDSNKLMSSTSTDIPKFEKISVQKLENGTSCHLAQNFPVPDSNDMTDVVLSQNPDELSKDVVHYNKCGASTENMLVLSTSRCDTLIQFDGPHMEKSDKLENFDPVASRETNQITKPGNNIDYTEKIVPNNTSETVSVKTALVQPRVIPAFPPCTFIRRRSKESELCIILEENENDAIDMMTSNDT